MKKTPLKRKSILKAKTNLKRTGTLSRGKGILKRTELNKQSEKAKEQWEEARHLVMLRDNNKCQICGKPGTQVHHIHLRSKRKDLLYSLNNLILLCDKHHFHQGMERYLEQTELIAHSKGITVEELLKQAEE